MSDSEDQKKLLDQVILDDIVHVDYNQDTLKGNFQAILAYLQKLKNQVNREAKNNQSNSELIKDLASDNKQLQADNKNMKNDVQHIQDQNNDLREEIRQLKERADKSEDNHEALKEDHKKSKDRIQSNELEIEELKKNIKGLLDKMNDLERQIRDIQKDNEKLQDQIKAEKRKSSIIQPKDGSDGIDSSALNNILEELQKMRDEFVTKEDFDNKCNQYDQQFVQTQEQIDDLKNRLKDLENRVQEISDKLNNANMSSNNNNQGASIDPAELEALREMIKKRVDTERFEREINNLKKLISQLSNVGGGEGVQIVQGGLGEEEQKMIDQMKQQLENLEEELRKLRRDVDTNKSEYSRNKDFTDKRIDNLENQMKFKASADEVKHINNNLQLVQDNLGTTTELAQENERRINQLKQKVDNHEHRISNQGGNNNNMNNNDMYGGNGGDGVSEELVDEKIRKCKEELLNLLKALKEEKVSYDDLWKSEAVILEKLDEVAGALLKKLADKGDTKKALIYLEKKINQLYMMISKNGGQGPDGDGLLVKRPLLWSCIACDKDLDKFQGRMGDYKNWAVFPPKETTPERMGRFGKGYKSLLEKSRQKEERIRMENSRMQQESAEQLPNIHKTPGMGGMSTQGQGYNENQQ